MKKKYVRKLSSEELDEIFSTIADHSEILAALRARDPERVEKCVRAHFSNIRGNWKGWMKRDGKGKTCK